MPGFSVHHQLQDLTQTHAHQSVMSSNHIIFCHPLLLSPSNFPSIRVFSNESILPIRWPKYWSFSSSISLSNEYLGLPSFMIDLFGLPAVQSESEVAQLCQTLCDPMDCNPSGSSVHGILQARTLEWVAISFSISRHRKSCRVRKGKHNLNYSRQSY